MYVMLSGQRGDVVIKETCNNCAVYSNHGTFEQWEFIEAVIERYALFVSENCGCLNAARVYMYGVAQNFLQSCVDTLASNF